MEEHVQKLLEAGLVYKITRTRWCSPPLIVKKPGVNQFRMTVDVRGGNERTVGMVRSMPMLEVVIEHLHGAECFFALHFFKGYWQFSLEESYQEYFSFLTDTGVYTPTRVLMGGSDSVAYCQSMMQEMILEQQYKEILSWLDDLLVYASNTTELVKRLEAVLHICEQKGLKLNPKKCDFWKSDSYGVES